MQKSEKPSKLWDGYGGCSLKKQLLDEHIPGFKV